MDLIFDVEANGLLETVSKIHSLVIRDATSGEILKSCYDDGLVNDIPDGLELMSQARSLIGHNIDGYDLPALKKVLNWEPNPETKIYDTLVACRLAYSNIFEREVGNGKTQEEMGYKHGSQSLEAWGARLGEAKLKFGEEDEDKEKTFEFWTPEMQAYCRQDTKVNFVLYQKLLSLELPPEALEIEHAFNLIMQEQMRNGILFNSQKAEILAAELKKEVGKIEQWAVDNIQPKIIKLKTKEKVIPFNIGSTDQVADYFKAKYNWEPFFKTKTGKAQVNGDVLASLNFPEARIFRDYNDRSKILGFLTEGKNAWLKSVKEDGRIYGYVNSNGQITGRIKMYNPNLGQIPGSESYKGKECRSLFMAREGHSLVDCDAAGIQLRMLGHYLHKYDGGLYAREIAEGDVHTRNMHAAELPSRPIAKEWIYAFLFGAGQEKLGAIANPDLSVEEKRALGKKFKNKFLNANPAISDLLQDCKDVFTHRGHIKSLDGRVLYPRGDYKTLNTLLQGGEAVVMKKACNLATQKLKEKKINYFQVAYIHDEILLEVREGQEIEAGEIVKAAIVRAGECLNLKIPLDGAYKIGKTWEETH